METGNKGYSQLFGFKELFLINSRVLFFCGLFVSCQNSTVINRADAVNNFSDNVGVFTNLLYGFDNIKERYINNDIKFEIVGSDRFSMIINPCIVLPTSKEVFCFDEKLILNNARTDSLLTELSMRNIDVNKIINGLVGANCQWIRSTQFYQNPIEVFYKRSGLGSFSYLIYRPPLNESLNSIHGTPLLINDRMIVYLSFSSSL